MHKMKKLALLLLALAMVLSLAACGGEDANTTPAPTATENVAETPAASDGAVQEETSVWDSAQYTEDTELGEGANTITFECTAEDRTVTFTIHTDAEYLRAALEDKGYEFISADVAMVPSTYTALSDPDDLKKMGILLDHLEDDDDVQNVWHNLENEEDLDR